MSTIQEFEAAAAKATQASAQADTWANGPINTTVPTDSGPVPTIAEFNRAAQERADNAIDALGWVLAGDFTAGCTVTDRNQYVLVVGGAGYRWDGVLPKVVAPGSSPTPISTGSWVLVGDMLLQSQLLSEAIAHSAGIMNRSSVKFLSCPPTTNNDGQLLTMQSFWVDPIKNEVWLGYDNSDRTRQVVERRKFNGTVVSSDVYTGANSVGHLDGFHVNSDDSVFCTDKFTNPSVLRIKNGVILERLTYSMTTQGNQVLAVDRSFSDRFVLVTKDTGGIVRVYTGLFSGAVSGVLQITDTGIDVSQSETIQGVAVLYDRVYMLTGDGGLFTNKYLYEWRIADGTLVAKLPHNPNRLYAVTDYSANSREPEGLNVVFEGLHNEQQVQIYSGVLFADFGASVVHNVIFKHSPAVARSHVPTFNGWVGRADGAEQFRPVLHCILFRKVSGSWKVWDGNLESYLSRSLVTRVVAGGSSNKGLVFDLANSYQALIGVISITCNSGLRQTAGVELFWTEKNGGSNSRLNHKINFLRVSDNVYLDADDASIPDGSWISLSLMVAM